MANYAAAPVCSTPGVGVVNLTDVTTLAPGVGNLPSLVYFPQLGTIVTGHDNLLGGGEYIFLKGVASLAVGDVVEYNGLTGVTTRWAGTANTGKPLAVAISAPSATQYGWFQISGNAIATISSTVAAGDSAFFSATATLKTAPAAGKQVLNCIAALANGGTIATGFTVTSTQAVYSISRPFCQGQIS